MRAAPSAAFAAAALFTAGCYTNATVSPVAVNKVAAAPAPVELGTAFDSARLGPRTEVRTRHTDGSVSPWFSAASMATSPRGLLTGRSLSLTRMSVATVRGLGPNGPALVAFLSPPGGHMWVRDDEITLQAARPGLLARWAAAVAAGSLNGGESAGVWTFQAPGTGWLAEGVGGGSLATVPLSQVDRLRLVEGVSWSKVADLELHNFDPLTTVAAMGAAALLVAMVIASAKANVDPSPVLDLAGRTAAVAIDDAARASAEGPPSLELSEGARHEAFLIDTAGADETLKATPAFTSSARRRDLAKLLLSVDSGLDDHLTATGGAGVGVRLFDFWELSARARMLRLASDGAVGTVAPRQDHLLYGGRLALHVDGDGQPLTALVLGGEVMMGALDAGRSLTATSLFIGPRFGIGRKTFVSLLLAPTHLSMAADSPEARVSDWRLMFAAELGLTL